MRGSNIAHYLVEFSTCNVDEVEILGTVRVDDPGVILYAVQEVIQVRSNSSNRVRILLIGPEL